jgi:uncharacterized protein YbdZ (MbtH family)
MRAVACAIPAVPAGWRLILDERLGIPAVPAGWRLILDERLGIPAVPAGWRLILDERLPDATSTSTPDAGARPTARRNPEKRRGRPSGRPLPMPRCARHVRDQRTLPLSRRRAGGMNAG